MSDAWFLDLHEEAAKDNVRRQLLFGDKDKARRWNTAWRTAHGVDLIQRIEDDAQHETAPAAADTLGAKPPTPSQTPLGPTIALTNGGNGLAIGIGILFLVVGLLMIFAGFATDASVPTGTGGFVNNTGKLNDKLLLVVAGSAFLVSGSVFLARPKPLLVQ